MTYDLAGQRFGKLTVLALAESHRKKNRQWLCRCDCGGLSTPTTDNLRNGNSTACGRCRTGSNAAKKHGAACGGKTSATYISWHSMKSRVRYKAEYRHVSIDPRWEESFEAFVADMGERPEGTTLDRIDNDQGYWRSNCRWATPSQQTRNRRITKRFTVNGVTLSAGEWAERAGITYAAALHRLTNNGSLRLKNAV